MASTPSRTLTIELDEATFRRVERTARRTGRSPERVIGQILDLSLSSASATRIAEWNAVVDRFHSEPPDELRKLLYSSMTRNELARMEALLRANRERDLTVAESAELDGLEARMLEVSTERAAAGFLLGSTQPSNDGA